MADLLLPLDERLVDEEQTKSISIDLPSPKEDVVGKNRLAHHGSDSIGQRRKAKALCLVISYDFAEYGEWSRVLGNNHDLKQLQELFSSCYDCEFRNISPSALSMRNGQTLSALKIQETFHTCTNPPTIFFLFILSHGLEQGIILTDILKEQSSKSYVLQTLSYENLNKEIKIEDLFESFTTQDVLLALRDNVFLNDAVKLIFFGPCRGGNVEIRSVPDQGFIGPYYQDAQANRYATRVESLPNQENFAIFYSTVESTRARRHHCGTVMVNSFISTINAIEEDTNIICLMTKLIKSISKDYAQTPQFTIFPHAPTFFCARKLENFKDFDGFGTRKVDFMQISRDLFRRAFIFRDTACEAVARKFECSLQQLGFQVHFLELEKLMPIATNISRLGMMNNEAWLLMFVFTAVEQVSYLESQCTELAIVASADGTLKSISSLVGLFTGVRCSTYAEKPKMFFFLDANGLSFDDARSSVHHQWDIKDATNNHSGILICASADADFIEKLPAGLEQMITARKSVQQVVHDLMEMGKTRLLTRLWSTTPKHVCILENKECPVHPMVVSEGETMTLSAVAQLVKNLRSEKHTVVAAASEQERHAASTELYSQLVVENHSQEILHLDTSVLLNGTFNQQQSISTLYSRINSSEHSERILVVVEDCGIETREFLRCFLKYLSSRRGTAVIVALESGTDSIYEIIAETHRITETCKLNRKNNDLPSAANASNNSGKRELAYHSIPKLYPLHQRLKARIFIQQVAKTNLKFGAEWRSFFAKCPCVVDYWFSVQTHSSMLDRELLRCYCLVISYEFGDSLHLSRSLYNSHDLINLEEFFSSCCDCKFQSISPSALDLREGHTFSAEGIKEIFQEDDPPTILFVFILSHGLEQGVILTDTKLDEHNFDSFTTTDVLTALRENDFLKESVKLIFFGPCRGVMQDRISSKADEAQKFATCVQSLPNVQNFGIFFSTIESTMSAAFRMYGTSMVMNFIKTMQNIEEDTTIHDILTIMTKSMSKPCSWGQQISQMPQFTVYPHASTHLCKWASEKPKIYNDVIETMPNADSTYHLTGEPFRRAFIFRDAASESVAGKYESSLNKLGFQVHCLELEKLMPTATNISRLGMMNNEAWLLMFVFTAIEQVTLEGRCSELAIAVSADGTLKPMRDVVGLFTGAKCPTYAGKPKIFCFLDEKNVTFDNTGRTFLLQQHDINKAINNHSGFLICSSENKEFITYLPDGLEQMTAQSKPLQKVVLDLMEADGGKRHLTRLWSTAPEDIRILESKECPVHPTVVCNDKTMTLSAVVQFLKTRPGRENYTVVVAASEQERHAASTELYSQLVVENHSQEILYLDTLDTLNPTRKQERIVSSLYARLNSIFNRGNAGMLAVIEYCGIETREGLIYFLKNLYRCGGNALIVTLQSEIQSLEDVTPEALLQI